MGGWEDGKGRKRQGLERLGERKGILTLRQNARECCIDEVVWILDRLDVCFP